jgi:uncharacterized Tic20 family protein
MSDVVSNEPPVAGMSSEEKQWGMFAHLSGVVAVWLGGLGFLGPLIVWLIKRDEMPFVNDQGKEALNYQLNVLVLFAVLGPIAGILAVITFGLLLIPVGLGFIVLVFVMPILAAIKANAGEAYRYPYIIRVIS